MSQAGRFTPEVVPGTYIEQINGDTGSVSGAVVSFNANPVSGSSLSFDGFGTTMLFNVTDINVNTIIGNSAGNNSITGIQNTSVGAVTLAALTTGSQNVMVGVGAGDRLLTGSYNIGIGFDAGDAYTSSESSNILLNNSGTIADSHTLRIGAGTGTANGELNRAYIAGIEGVTVPTADQILVIDGADQIGVIAAGTAGYILTSSGPADNPVWAPSSAMQAIDGDIGSATGSPIAFNAFLIAGSSTAFDASGSTVTFNVTDILSNTLIGLDAGNATVLGSNNTGLGKSALAAITSGAKNTAVGFEAGTTITTGSNNIYVGSIDGTAVAESNTTRIGNDGDTAACYILGIGGVDVGATANLVVEDSDQLGTAVLAAGTNIAITTGSNIITIASNSSVISHYVTVTNAASPYTALSSDYYISADVTSGAVSVLLPNAPTTGRTFIIKDKVGLAATSNVTVTTVGGTVTIDGAVSFVMNTAYEAVSVLFNGTSYEVW